MRVMLQGTTPWRIRRRLSVRRRQMYVSSSTAINRQPGHSITVSVAAPEGCQSLLLSNPIPDKNAWDRQPYGSCMNSQAFWVARLNNGTNGLRLMATEMFCMAARDGAIPAQRPPPAPRTCGYLPPSSISPQAARTLRRSRCTVPPLGASAKALPQSMPFAVSLLLPSGLRWPAW